MASPRGTTEEERAARQSHVQRAESDFDPLPFDVPAARAFGRVALALRRSGPRGQTGAYDVMIAATAIANGLTLYGRLRDVQPGGQHRRVRAADDAGGRVRHRAGLVLASVPLWDSTPAGHAVRRNGRRR
jgi:hypothetical protein